MLNLFKEAKKKSEGTKDAGGYVAKDGYYKLVRGERVINNYDYGKFGQQSINATININGAQDPQSVAHEVKRTIQQLSSRVPK
jgi:hypothetical protein